jgi:hypothetical protein
VDWAYILKAFFLAYNVVINAPVAIVNFMIIFKEIFLEYFQLLSNNVGGDI